jgi:hypothetical protein
MAATDQQSVQQSIQSQESTVAGLAARLQRFGVTPTAAGEIPLAAITSPMSGVVNQAGSLTRRGDRILIRPVHGCGPFFRLGAGRGL